MPSVDYSKVWHTGPTMTGSGTLTTWRNDDGHNPNIQIRFTASNWISSTDPKAHYDAGYISCIVVLERDWGNGNWGGEEQVGYFDLTAPFSRTAKSDTKEWTFYCEQKARFKVYFDCHQMNTSCTKGYSHINMDIPYIEEGAYVVPWSNPSPASNVSVSASSVSPFQSLDVWWNVGASGTGNTLTQQTLNYKIYRNGAWTGRVAYNDNVPMSTNSIRVDLNRLGLKPRRKNTV